MDLSSVVPLALDAAEVAYETGPTGEPVLARDDELGIGELEAVGRRFMDRGMARPGALERVTVTGLELAQQRLAPLRSNSRLGRDGSGRNADMMPPFDNGPKSA